MSSKGLPSEAPAWERTSLTDTPPPAPEKERTRGPQRSWGSSVVKCKGVGTKLGVQEFCGARSGTIPTAARSPQGSSSFQKGCLGFHSSFPPPRSPPRPALGGSQDSWHPEVRVLGRAGPTLRPRRPLTVSGSFSNTSLASSLVHTSSTHSRSRWPCLASSKTW